MKGPENWGILEELAKFLEPQQGAASQFRIWAGDLIMNTLVKQE